MNFRSTRNGNSVYDEMKARVYKQRLLDVSSNISLQEIEEKYIFDLFKLDEISLLENESEEVKKQFCNQKLYIETLDIEEREKIDLILTTTCLFTRAYEQVKDLNETSLHYLIFSMKNVELEKYNVYSKALKTILTDKSCQMFSPSYQKAVKILLKKN